MTAQTTFTMDSAPFVTYRYIGNGIDPARSLTEQAIPLSQTANQDYRTFNPDIIVTVCPEYRPNASWRALVFLIHPEDGDEHAYFLAR